MSTPLLGIAIYAVNATDITDCRWNLVLSKGSFDAPDAHIYAIAKDRSAWRSDHRVALLASAPALRGVLQVLLSPDLPLRFTELHDFIHQFPATADGYNTRDRGWGSTMYTHRVLDSLCEAGCIHLPCVMDDLILRVEQKTTSLTGRRNGRVHVMAL